MAAPDGTFSFDTLSGDYALTATAPAGFGAYEPMRSYSTGSVRKLVLASRGFTLSGKIKAPASWSAARVELGRISHDEGDTFYTPVAADGTYSVRLMAAEGWQVRAVGDGWSSASETINESRDRELVLKDSVVGSPFSDEDRAALLAVARPLASVDADENTADLEQALAVLKTVRVVGAGEASHGTSEFFRMKQRLYRWLVETSGPIDFALEASLSGCAAIDDDVNGGSGDAAALIGNLNLWPWDTHEMVALVEWMRVYNQSKSGAARIHFFGFDMQYDRPAYQVLLRYMARAGIEPPRLMNDLNDEWRLPWQTVASRARITELVDKLHPLLDGPAPHRAELSPFEVALAKQSLRSLEQAAKREKVIDRDVFMAENVLSLLSQQAASRRLFVWAHNLHINKQKETMGGHLSEALSGQYYALALNFDRGEIRAAKYRLPLRSNNPVAANPLSISHALAQMGCPLCAMDFRTLDATGRATKLLHEERPLAQCGWLFFDPPYNAEILADDFDGAIFVETSHPPQPLFWYD